PARREKVMRAEAPLARVTAAAYEIPTDAPEADGTLEWDRTTLVAVEVEAGGKTGLGYTYSDASIAGLIEGKLAAAIADRPALDIAGAGAAMWRSIRNLGRSGLAATAISAVDAALWDLKGRLLGLPVAALLGKRRDRVPIYGSGGFTSYADERLGEQLAGWVGTDGCRWVKMKIGSEPQRARRSATPPACSSTPTAPFRRGRRWRWPSASPNTASRGSRSRSAPTISPGSPGCATVPPAAWISPPASTATTSTISGGCCRWSTCCRRTQRAAAGLPGFSRLQRWARRTTPTCRATARRPCICT